MKKLALILLAIFIGSLLGFHELAQAAPRPNFFDDYHDFMPGEPIKVLKVCSSYYIPSNVIYMHCDLEQVKIDSMSLNGIITSSTFFVKNKRVALPDLIRWYGKYQQFGHRQIVWNEVTALFNHWGGMLSFPSAVVFHNFSQKISQTHTAREKTFNKKSQSLTDTGRIFSSKFPLICETL